MWRVNDSDGPQTRSIIEPTITVRTAAVVDADRPDTIKAKRGDREMKDGRGPKTAAVKMLIRQS